MLIFSDRSQLIIAITIAITKLTGQSGFHLVCIFYTGIIDSLDLMSHPEKSKEIWLDLAIRIYL